MLCAQLDKQVMLETLQQFISVRTCPTLLSSEHVCTQSLTSLDRPQATRTSDMLKVLARALAQHSACALCFHFALCNLAKALTARWTPWLPDGARQVLRGVRHQALE